MINKPIRFLMGLGLFVGVLSTHLTPPPIAAAPAPGDKCDELQVVFVTDQSGSMSAPPGGEPPSDPQGLRFKGPEEAIRSLALMRYLSYQSSAIRVAVVHFGDRPKTQLEWTDLNVLAPEDYDKLMRGLEPKLAAVPQLGNTNHRSAFQAASSLFNQLEAVRAQKGDCPRRVVIILTDGMPYLDVPGFVPAAHINELKAYAKRYMTAPNYQIYVIGLDDTNKYWDRVKKDWEDVSGDAQKVRRVRDTAEIGEFINEIVRVETGVLGVSGSPFTSVCVKGGTVNIPPFVQQANFILVKPPNRTDIHLQLKDQTGLPVDVARKDIKVTLRGENDPIEALQVLLPPPGTWAIQPQSSSDGSRCQVRMDLFQASGKLITPSVTDTLTQFKKVPVKVQIVDQKGGVLPEYPGYGLNITATLRGPKGNMTPFALQRSGGLYEYVGEMMPLDVGDHQLLVRGTTKNPDGSDNVVVDSNLGPLRAQPVVLSLTTAPNSIIPQFRQVPLAFELMAAGKPATLDLPIDVSIVITRANTTVPITVTRSATGTYQSNFNPNQAGSYILAYSASATTPSSKAVITGGEYRFEVSSSTLVRARFIEPNNDTYIATDYLNRATGLPLQIQLVDEAGRDLDPAQMGVANPATALKLTVLDGKKTDVSDKVRLLATGKPGLYRLDDNTLGRDTYDITVQTNASLNTRFIWEQDKWTRTVTGVINPAVWGALAGMVGIVLAILAIILAWWASLRHPLTGVIHIYSETITMNSDNETSNAKSYLLTKQLPKRNRATLLNVSLFNRKAPIRRVVATCENDTQYKNKKAKVEITFATGKKRTYNLGPGQVVPLSPTSYFIAKDPAAGSNSGGSSPEIGNTDGYLQSR